MKATPRRILVIKHGALGDLVLALAAMQAIRRHHRHAAIDILTTAPFAALLRQSCLFDDILIDRRARPYRLDLLLPLASKLRQAGYDTVYDLQGSERTAWYFRTVFAGRHRPNWYGTARGCSHHMDRQTSAALHPRERHAALLLLAGIEVPATADFGFLQGDTGRFDLRPPYVLLASGGAPRRTAKRWPAENYAELAASLSARGLQPLLIGAPGETAAVRRNMGNTGCCVDLGGRTTLGDLAALARAADAAIGNDTGPMHLFAALGCPTLTLFGAASDPDLSRPRGPNSMVLSDRDIAEIPVDIVMEALDKLREQARHGAAIKAF